MVAKTDAAGRRVKKAGEAPKAALVDKDISVVSQSIVDYIKAQTGYDADPMSVQLGSVLRGDFQKSPENQERIAAAKQRILDEQEAREQRAAEREEKRAAREAAKAAKAAEPKVAKEKPAAKTAATKTTAKAPAKTAATTKRTATAKAPVKPARRRAAAKVADDSDEF